MRRNTRSVIEEARVATDPSGGTVHSAENKHSPRRGKVTCPTVLAPACDVPVHVIFAKLVERDGVHGEKGVHGGESGKHKGKRGGERENWGGERRR